MKRKYISFFVALIMIVSVFNFSVISPAAMVEVTVTDIDGLLSAIDDFNSAATPDDYTVTIAGPISASATGRGFSVSQPGKSLTLKGGGSLTGFSITVENESGLVLDNFSLNGVSATSTFFFTVEVISGRFDMLPGSEINVSGNESGVLVMHNSTFNLRGGSITGSNPAGNACGVDTGGVFNMISGSISGCGQGVVNSNSGTFTMTGGSITNNTYTGSEGGGGVCNNGSFIMTGGIISGNKAPKGGGVYHDTTGANSLIIGGTAVIRDNTDTAGSQKNNLYLVNNAYVTLDTVTVPVAGMKIWLRTETTGGVFVNSGATAAHAAYFESDDAALSVSLTQTDKLMLSASAASGNRRVTVYNSYAGSALSGEGDYNPGDTVWLRAGTRAGYTFDGWYVNGMLLSPSDLMYPNVSFIMPDNDVTATAYWRLVSTVTYGDLNDDGKVDLADLVIMHKYFSVQSYSGYINLANADVDGSGGLPNVADWVHFSKYFSQPGIKLGP